MVVCFGSSFGENRMSMVEELWISRPFTLKNAVNLDDVNGTPLRRIPELFDTIGEVRIAVMPMNTFRFDGMLFM